MPPFIILISAIVLVDTALAGKSCPGGYSDGTRMDIGRYWYECNNGKVTPKGCLGDDGRRIDVDTTFDGTDYKLRCVMGSDGYLTLIYKGCVHRGSGHDINAQWDDGTSYYTCVQDGATVRIVKLGCYDQGRPIKFEERVAKSDYVYQCKKAMDGGAPRLDKVGCVYQGRKYNIGEQFEGTKYLYTCSDHGPVIVGCMHNGRRLLDGDRKEEEDMAYTCKVNDKDTHYEPFACLQREDGGAKIERRVGCFWVEGVGTEAYEYTCKVDSADRIVKVQTQCVYRASEGYFKTAPGCVVVAGAVAVRCDDVGSGRLRLTTYSANGVTSTC